MPLKNRLTGLPNGFQYRQPETNWVPDRYSSFASVVAQLIHHRLGNPHLMEKNGYSVDRATVEMEVDNFNTAFCRAMGGDWLAYVEGGPAPPIPFHNPPPPPNLSPFPGGVAAVKKLASGMAVLFDWEEGGEPPVAPELSAKRAAVCAPCPKNSPGALSQYLTGPLSDGFRKRLERLHQMNLNTPSDAQLFACEACLCPMRLKVHAPLSLIEARLKPEVRAELDPRCWILSRDQ